MPAALPGPQAAEVAPRPPRPAAARGWSGRGFRRAAGGGRGNRGGSRRRGGDGGNGIRSQCGFWPPPVSFGVSILADSDLASAGGFMLSGLVPSGLPLSALAVSLLPVSVLPVSDLRSARVLALSFLGVSSFAASPFAGSSLPGSVLGLGLIRIWAALRRRACPACSVSAWPTICGHRGRARWPPAPEFVPPRQASRPAAPGAWRCGRGVRAQRPVGLRLGGLLRLGLGLGSLLGRRWAQPAAEPVELLGQAAGLGLGFLILAGLALAPDIAGIGRPVGDQEGGEQRSHLGTGRVMLLQKALAASRRARSSTDRAGSCGRPCTCRRKSGRGFCRPRDFAPAPAPGPPRNSRSEASPSLN